MKKYLLTSNKWSTQSRFIIDDPATSVDTENDVHIETKCRMADETLKFWDLFYLGTKDDTENLISIEI